MRRGLKSGRINRSVAARHPATKNAAGARLLSLVGIGGVGKSAPVAPLFGCAGRACARFTGIVAFMTGDDGEGGSGVAMGDGDAGVGGHGDGRRDARHDLEGHARLAERFGLLAAAREHEGVPALQTHDRPPTAPVLDEEGGTAPVQVAPITIQIPKDDLDKARAQGWGYELTLLMRKGRQKVAVGVRDDLGGTSSYVSGGILVR